MLRISLLATTLLLRALKAGEWLVVLLALILSVAAVTSLHFYIDRLMRGIDAQSAKFLGGDLVVQSGRALPSGWTQKAHAFGLQTAEVWSYPTVVSSKGKLQLVYIQAVSDSYPLLGENKTNPAAHTVWVEPRLLKALSLKINDTIPIGASSFRIIQILSGDIDTLNTGFAIAPRVMISLRDVPATKILLPGSRVDYRLLLVGSKQQIKQFSNWISPHLATGQQLLTVHNQRLGLRNTLQQTESYLQLVLLVCIIMSSMAILLSIQQYLRQHAPTIALWRCLGACSREISQILVTQLLLVAIMAGFIGILLGYSAQAIFVTLFKSYVAFPLPAASKTPFFTGFGVSIFLLLAFAYPVITELPKTPPLFIWREELKSKHSFDVYYFIIAILMLILILGFTMGFSRLTLIVLIILLFSLGLLYSLHYLLLSAIRSLIDKTVGTFRRGLMQLLQFPTIVRLQLTAFTLIFMSLLVLSQVKNDILQHWQQSLPANTPNYFAFNIAPADLADIKKRFTQQNIHIDGIYPMLRGRLTELNGKPIMSAIPKEALSHNALHRELNLSTMWQFPSDNKIVAGRAWTQQDAGKPLISVEASLRDSFQLKLGDILSFQIGDRKLAAKIDNFRTLDWASFHPNFYIIFPPGLLDDPATTYITSFHLPQDKVEFVNKLIADFPNITVIDVANLLNEIQTLVGKISMAMQYLFLFALATGILIFIAGLQATMDERRKTYRLLRTLGASRRYIVKSLWVEFSVILLIMLLTSIFLAKIASTLVLYYIHQL